MRRARPTRPDFARWCFTEGLARELLLRPIGNTRLFHAAVHDRPTRKWQCLWRAPATFSTAHESAPPSPAASPRYARIGERSRLSPGTPRACHSSAGRCAVLWIARLWPPAVSRWPERACCAAKCGRAGLPGRRRAAVECGFGRARGRCHPAAVLAGSEPADEPCLGDEAHHDLCGAGFARPRLPLENRSLPRWPAQRRGRAGRQPRPQGLWRPEDHDRAVAGVHGRPARPAGSIAITGDLVLDRSFFQLPRTTHRCSTRSRCGPTTWGPMPCS